jgi:hypothetical protein
MWLDVVARLEVEARSDVAARSQVVASGQSPNNTNTVATWVGASMGAVT